VGGVWGEWEGFSDSWRVEGVSIVRLFQPRERYGLASIFHLHFASVIGSDFIDNMNEITTA
jgi:hypothetical protein